MIVCMDVDYGTNVAHVGAVVFPTWTSPDVVAEYTLWGASKKTFGFDPQMEPSPQSWVW